MPIIKRNGKTVHLPYTKAGRKKAKELMRHESRKIVKEAKFPKLAKKLSEKFGIKETGEKIADLMIQRMNRS